MFFEKLKEAFDRSIQNAKNTAIRIEMRFRISLIRHTCHDGVFIIRKYPELNNALAILSNHIECDDPNTPAYQILTKHRRAYLHSLYRDYGSSFDYTLQWLLVHVGISDQYPKELVVDPKSEYSRGGKYSRVTTRL